MARDFLIEVIINHWANFRPRVMSYRRKIKLCLLVSYVTVLA